VTHMRVRTIAITGASGLVGRALCTDLSRRGYRVHAFTRNPDAQLSALPNVSRYACDLPDRLDSTALFGCDVIVHCAYVTRFRSQRQAKRVNEVGTQRLMTAAHGAGVPRFVFLSTTSAHAEALSYYGQSKFRLESALDPERDLVVRPGLVVSAQGGLFQRMAGRRAGATSSWLVPLFDGGGQPMQTIFIDDLCEGIRHALEYDLRGSLILASPERMTVREFFEAVAAFGNRRPRFVDVPPEMALLAFRAAEAVRLPLPVSSENLLGLLSLRYWDSAADLERAAITARPLGETLTALHRLSQ
jgi:nucleoside-diphosphate-sugar epimerase